MNDELSRADLKRAVEKMHGCRAKFREVVAVVETFRGKLVWDGEVQVFDVTRHPTAKVCYVWSSPVEGTERRKVFAVLGIPPVKTAVDAVRASIVAEHQKPL